MSCRRFLRAVLLVTFAFATAGGTAGGPSVGLVATVATVTFVSAGCGPDGGDGAAGPEQSLADIGRSVESAVNDGKTDSPNRPTILGDISPNTPAMGQFRPERRYIGWLFNAEERPQIRITVTPRERQNNMVTLLLWRPDCSSPWRTVAVNAAELSQTLPTDGSYLVVVGPRNARASGAVQTLLVLAEELFAAISPSACPPGPATRPPMPNPLPPVLTPPVGAIPGNFQVTDLGSANYSIQLDIPPGRAGMQPSLALTYDSSSGNGLLGTGFQLQGLSTIARCPKDPAHDGARVGIRFTAADRFCLDGARLVQIPGSSPTEYRTERETFTRIRAYGDDGGGPTSFRAWSKDGRVLLFGSDPNDASQDFRVRSKQTGTGGNYTIAWPLRRVEDRSGNFYTISYENVAGPADETVEQRPSSIAYTGWTNVPPFGKQVIAPTKVVTFSYLCDGLSSEDTCKVGEADRPDPFHGYAYGVQTARTALLRRIDISGPAPTATGAPGATTLSRQYRLSYRNDGGSTPSQLASVTECAAEGSGFVCKAPTRFGWSAVKRGFRGLASSPSMNAPDSVGFPNSWGYPPVIDPVYSPFLATRPSLLHRAIDADGDGRSDILYPQGGTWKVLRSNGAGFEATPIDTGISIFGGEGSNQRPWIVTPMDYDGDGRTDLLVSGFTANHWVIAVALSRGTSFERVNLGQNGYVWEGGDSSTQPRDRPVIAQPGALDPIVADFDGDGRQEALVCDPYRGNWMEFSAPKTGMFDPIADAPRVSNRVRWVQSPSAPASGAHCLEESILPIDLDGDGTIEVLVAASNSHYSSPTVQTDILQADLQGTPRGNAWTQVLDVNGDGLSDIVTLQPGISNDSGALRLFVNRGDGHFERLSVNEDFPLRPNTIKAAAIVDYDHDGRSDLFLAGMAGGSAVALAYRSDGMTLAPAPWQAPWAITSEQLVRYPTLLDVDGDGVLDLVTFQRPNSSASSGTWDVRAATEKGEAPGLMTEIREGLVAQLGPSSSYVPSVRIRYSSMNDSAVHGAVSAGSCRWPIHCVHSGGGLVASVEMDNGNVAPRPFGQVRYDYAQGRVDLRGRGFLGFLSRHIVDTTTGAETFRHFFQGDEGAGAGDTFQEGSETDYRIAGLLRLEAIVTPLEGGSQHLRTVVNTPSVRVYTFGSGSGVLPSPALPSLRPPPATYLPYVKVSTATSNQDGADYSTLTTTVELQDATFGCVKKTTRDYGGGSSEIAEILDFETSADEWLLCMPRLEERRSTTPDEAQRRQVALTYIPRTRLIDTITRAPGDDPTAFQLVKRFYDRYGNATQVNRRANVPGCIDNSPIPCTRIETFTFDEDGTFPVSETNAAGHRLDYRSHPTHGALLVRQDENGLATRWGLDAFGRVARELRADNTEALKTFRSVTDSQRPGFEIEASVTGGDSTTRRYDSLGREVRASHYVLDGRAFVETQYNDKGLVERTSRPATEGAPARLFTVFGHDNLGRTTYVQYPDGTVGRTKYLTGHFDDDDPVGLVVEATDQVGRITRTYQGRKGERVASVQGADTPRAATTRLTYGAFGHVLRIRALGEGGTATTTSVATDSYGRKQSQDDPDLGRIDYVWTGFDELDNEQNPARERTTYLRDVLGRVVKRIDPDRDVAGGTVETTWTWDAAPFGIGKVAETKSPPHRHTRSVHRQVLRYDGLSRPSQVTTSLGDDAGIFVSRTTYDQAGRIDTISYPSSPGLGAFAVRNKYDDHGGLTDVFRWKPEGGGREAERYWHAEQVAADGQLTIEDFGNDVRTTRTYYPETGRQYTIRTGRSKAPLLQNLTYGYHPDGNLLNRWDETTEERFTYDEVGRLASTTSPQAPDRGLSLTYNPLGNISTKTDVGTYAYLAPRPGGGVRAHAVSQAGSASYVYEDATGGMVVRRDPSNGIDQQIEYTSFGKPSLMTGSGDKEAITIEYDADGNRLTRYSDRSRTAYAGDLYQRDSVAPAVRLKPGQARTTHLYFVEAAGRVVAQVVRRSGPEPTPFATRPRETEETYYLHDDHLGSTAVISSTAGSLVEKRSFDAFGKARQPDLRDTSAPPSSSTVPRGFTGHEDEFFGLVNMHGRIYDPRIARFMQPDPFVVGADGQGLNRFSYVLNNPLRYTDPSGYEPRELTPEEKEWNRRVAEEAKTLELEITKDLSGDDLLLPSVAGLQSYSMDELTKRAQGADHLHPVRGPGSDVSLNRSGSGEPGTLQAFGTYVAALPGGLASGVKSGFVGLYNIIRHPVDTLRGIKETIWSAGEFLSRAFSSDPEDMAYIDRWFEGLMDQATVAGTTGIMSGLGHGMGSALAPGPGSLLKGVRRAPKVFRERLGPSAPPQVYHGPWTERDLARGLKGQGPLDMVPTRDAAGREMPLSVHHGGQMPGAAVHEVAPTKSDHFAPGMHNDRNRGVTDTMRARERELHWFMRAREMGAEWP